MAPLCIVNLPKLGPIKFRFGTNNGGRASVYWSNQHYAIYNTLPCLRPVNIIISLLFLPDIMAGCRLSLLVN